ncbi:MAG: hypothetical protein ACOZNI_31535 [Myxococcota bacterium]
MIFWLVGCGEVELEFSPGTLAFGEIDFSAELPEEGYAPETVTITNTGEKAGTLWLPEYDTERLCLAGFDADREYPVELGLAEPGDAYVLDVAVCGFGSGELETEVRIGVDVLVDDDPEPFTLPVTYTPVLVADA